MSRDLSVTDLLKGAVRYLDGDRSTAPNAAFSAALLARESLEDAFRVWSRSVLALELHGVSGRAQLAVVEEHVSDRETARRARYAWHELSSTLHHGPAAADPAAVRRLAVDVNAVVRALGDEVRQMAATRHNALATTQGAA